LLQPIDQNLQISSFTKYKNKKSISLASQSIKLKRSKISPKISNNNHYKMSTTSTPVITQRNYHPGQLHYPSQTQIDECRARTAAALGLSSLNNQSNGLESNLKPNTTNKEPQHIIHTSSRTGTQRVIQIHEESDDPFRPSRFKIKRDLRRPPSPPTVTLVDKSLTKTSQDELSKWKIPTAVSNWKNNKAHIIGVDARAMFEQSHTYTAHISSKHGDFLRALDDTMESNRDEVQARKELQLRTEYAQRERERIKLDQQAREIHLGPSSHLGYNSGNNNTDEPLYPTSGGYGTGSDGVGDDGVKGEGFDMGGDIDDILKAAGNQQQREEMQKKLQQDDYQRQREQRKLRDVSGVMVMTGDGGKKRLNDGDNDQDGGSAPQFSHNGYAIGSSGQVDDHVLIQANKNNRQFINEEDVYDGEELFDTSKSRHTGSAPSEMLNNVNPLSMGFGALTRQAPVLFERGETMGQDEVKKKENNTDNATTQSTGNQQRERDRQYQ
jgi:hypothetical protein